MPHMLTPSDLSATIGAGLTIREAAKMLRCSTNTVRRAAWAYRIPLPDRYAKVRGEAEWQAAVEKYGPGLLPIARGLGIEQRWVKRQLERYNINPGYGGVGGKPMHLVKELEAA